MCIRFMKSDGEEYQVVKRDENNMGMVKSIAWKKGKGEEYNIPHDIQAVGKNIKCGRGEGDGNFWGENKDLKKIFNMFSLERGSASMSFTAPAFERIYERVQ